MPRFIMSLSDVDRIADLFGPDEFTQIMVALGEDISHIIEEQLMEVETVLH